MEVLEWLPLIHSALGLHQSLHLLRFDVQIRERGLHLLGCLGGAWPIPYIPCSQRQEPLGQAAGDAQEGLLQPSQDPRHRGASWGGAYFLSISL